MTRLHLTTQWGSEVGDRVESPLGIGRLNYAWPGWAHKISDDPWTYNPDRWRRICGNKLTNATNQTRFEIGCPLFGDIENPDPEVIRDITRIAREEFIEAGDPDPRIAIWVAGADWLNACGKPWHADFEQRMAGLRSRLEAVADAGMWGATPFLYRGDGWNFDALVNNAVALCGEVGMPVRALYWTAAYPAPDGWLIEPGQVEQDLEWLCEVCDDVLIVANGGGSITEDQWESVRHVAKRVNCCPGGSTIPAPTGRRHVFVESANLDAARAAMQRVDRDPGSSGGFVSVGSGLWGLSTLVDDQISQWIGEVSGVSVFSGDQWTFPEALEEARNA